MIALKAYQERVLDSLREFFRQFGLIMAAIRS
jgi:hypothetical protein